MEPIVIGAAIAQSGFAAPYDHDPSRAAGIAIEAINAKGGVLGRPLKMIYADTKSDLAHGAVAGMEVLDSGADIVIVIFGIMRLINFAHGELVMIGAYAMWLLVELPATVVVVVSAGIVVLLALAMERSAFRPLREANASTMLVASFALSYLLQNLVRMTIGSRPKPFVFAEGLTGVATLGGLRIPLLQIVSMILTLVVLAAIVWFLKRTPLGVQMRAASQDFRMARLCGVRADRVIAVAFAMSGLLAWVVALVYAAQTGQISPSMGLRPALIGFVATVIGGLGSLPGAALGGFVVGVMTVVLVVLLVRPGGLLAQRAETERV